MTSIAGLSSYSSGYLNSSAPETNGTANTSRAGKQQDSPEENKDLGHVRVSLSKNVAQARLRESMGLEPTGRLTLSDFEQAARNQEKTVAKNLARTMDSLGISREQKISLSLDSKDELTIAESFPGKADLLKSLNDDSSFMTAFNQLSANQQVLDYTRTLTTRQTSMLDYMDDPSGWDSVMALASQYQASRSSGNSLSGLLGLSRSEVPYTYTHDPETGEA